MVSKGDANGFDPFMAWDFSVIVGFGCTSCPFLIGEPEEAVICTRKPKSEDLCSTQSDCEEGNACVQFPSTTVCRLICEDYDELCGEKTCAGGRGRRTGSECRQAFPSGAISFRRGTHTSLQDG